ncbi:MAG TPA: Asp-tRNA(Asn)/Glu-tRNA(Gln) amidotransferase GatCAB subunit A [Ruminiclostridium sp.]|nr:Asp-tRNA(Asn)/Glu-tRNA(Gln) amidotransferase GatCAB subunit A [Ruminiclostridium sp.]
MGICEKTLTETSKLLRSKEIGAEELTNEYLKIIKKNNTAINCYITICEKEAIESARRAQKLLDSGEALSMLCGIPAGIKDNICTKGISTTCASKMLADFVPPYSATVMDKLENQGIAVLGKLNMDEFAMGASSEHSIFGPVHNPWHNDCVAGGSSGGSAAAVAADLAVFALGSDTGGSIRQPASFCGVVGLKPTYGLVSRYGLVAFASSLDQIGPLTKDVTDCAVVLNEISGHDPMDSTSVKKEPENYLADIEKGVKGLKIGLPKEFFSSGLDSDVKKSILETIAKLGASGAYTAELTLPAIEHAVPAYYLISSAEASANLARYDGIRYGYRNKEAKSLAELYRLSRGEGFGREVKRRILLGTYALSSGYNDKLYSKALKVRRMIADEFNHAFEKCDVIAAPVYPTTAFKIGEKLEDPLKMYLGDIYTAGVNLAGLPGLSVPCGLDKKGLPIGIQLIGKAYSEKLLLRVGYAIEKAVGRIIIQRRKEGV